MAVDLARMARRSAVRAFGRPVTYAPRSGPSKTIRAVFTDPYALVEAGLAADVTGNAPTFGVHVADLPDPSNPKSAIGDAIVRESVTWRVFDVHEDGQGGAELLVQRGPQ